MKRRAQVAEVDVAAVVAEVLAQHAPGTTVGGQASGGVPVDPVTLDLATFRKLLKVLAGTLDDGSQVRLDVIGGVVFLDVTGSHLGAEHIDPLRVLAHAMNGHLVPDPPAAVGYSVKLPSGVSEPD